jgi:hypothetical protein
MAPDRGRAPQDQPHVVRTLRATHVWKGAKRSAMCLSVTSSGGAQPDARQRTAILSSEGPQEHKRRIRPFASKNVLSATADGPRFATV